MTSKDKLRKLVTQMYQEHGIEVVPTYPRILVRVLPREQQRGSLILPDSKQNKPVLEGVVLSTYKSFIKSEWDENGNKSSFEMKAPVRAGDHVLFPAIEFNIIPVWPLDDGVGEYRLVPEEHLRGVLVYHKEPNAEWLVKTLGMTEKMAEDLLKNANVIRKDIVPLTTSGA